MKVPVGGTSLARDIVQALRDAAERWIADGQSAVSGTGNPSTDTGFARFARIATNGWQAIVFVEPAYLVIEASPSGYGPMIVIRAEGLEGYAGEDINLLDKFLGWFITEPSRDDDPDPKPELAAIA